MTSRSAAAGSAFTHQLQKIRVREHQLRYEGWRDVAACGVGAFFATVPLNTFAIFLKPLCDHFSWSRESAASVYGALTLSAAASAPWLGSLIDRRGARKVILPALAVSACAVASLAALTSALWHFRVVFGVLGVAMMGASPIAYSRVIFGWFDEYRGRALGVMLIGAAISGIVLPPISQVLITMAGWRVAWLALGGTTLAIALPVGVTWIRECQPLGRDAALGSRAVTVAAALRSRVFWTLMVVVFGGTAATNGAIVHMVALLTDRGVPASHAALSVSAMGGASLVGRLVTGWLLDRFAAARVSTTMLVIVALGTFLLAAAHSLAAGIVAAACIGFGSGGEVDVVPYLLSRYFGLQSLSTLYGLNWTAWGLAGAAGPILLGRAFDASGSYGSALFQLGLLTLITAGLMLRLPPASLSAPSDSVDAEPA